MNNHKEQKLITGEMIIADVLELNPEAAKILTDKGMHCLGCSIASGETLVQAAAIHGIPLDELLEELNK